MFINDADLTVSGILMFSRLDVAPDMISGYEMVCDADMPLSVFVRKEMLGKIEIPGEAKRPIRNTMIYEPPENDGGDEPESVPEDNGKQQKKPSIGEKFFGMFRKRNKNE